MTIQYINTGSSANAGNGDSLRSAFNKVNNNFEYLSTATFGSSTGNGYTGSQGVVGFTGSQGNIGYTGSQGIVGFVGSQGDIGYTGSAVGTVLPGTAGRFAFYDGTGDVLSEAPNIELLADRNNLVIGGQFTNLTYFKNSYSADISSGFNIMQHHETQDTNNTSFVRTRGVRTARTPVFAQDDVADIVFAVLNQSNTYNAVSAITVSVESTSTGLAAGGMYFYTHDGINLNLAARLTSSSTFETSKLAPVTGTTVSMAGDFIPAADLTYDLGSTSSQWRSLYVGTSTIYLGGTALSVSGGNLTVDGSPVAGSGSATTSTLISGTYTVALSTSGSLTLPIGGTVSGNDDINIVVNNQDSSNYTWNFGNTGGLTLPSGGLLGQVWGDGLTTELTLKSPPGEGDSGYVALSSANEENYVEVSNVGVAVAVNFNTEGFKKWNFDTNGNLTLPSGTVSIGNPDGVGPEFIVAAADTQTGMLVSGSGLASISWVDTYPTPTSASQLAIDSYGVRLAASADVNNLNSWLFGTDASLTLPGVVKHSTIEKTGGAGSETSIALDLTKSVQVLVSADGNDDSWSLADGVEGQIMYFVPKGAGINNHYINIANVRYFSEGGYTVGPKSWIPFQIDDNLRAEDWRSLAVAVFTDGAWNTDTSWFD